MFTDTSVNIQCREKKSMITLKNALALGIQRGQNAALNVEIDSQSNESLETAASDAEQNSRQASDFIHSFSSPLAEQNNSDKAWTEYERGVTIGIANGIKTRNETEGGEKL